MAFHPKVLADGQMAASKTTIYEVPASTKTYLSQMRIFSTGAAQTVVIYLNVSGTSRRYGQFFLGLNESAEVFTQTVHLEAGDKLEGQTTSATTVDYIVTGEESSV